MRTHALRVLQRASRAADSAACASAGGAGPSSAPPRGESRDAALERLGVRSGSAQHWAAPPASPARGALSAEERALRVMQLMQDAQAAAARKPAPADALRGDDMPTPVRRRAWSPPVQPRGGAERAAQAAGEEDAHPLPSRTAAGRHAKEAVRAAVEEERRRAHPFAPALNAPRRNSPSPQPLPSAREAHLEQACLALRYYGIACSYYH